MIFALFRVLVSMSYLQPLFVLIILEVWLIVSLELRFLIPVPVFFYFFEVSISAIVSSSSYFEYLNASS